MTERQDDAASVTTLPSAIELGLTFETDDSQQLWAQFEPTEQVTLIEPWQLGPIAIEAGVDTTAYPIDPQAAHELIEVMRRGQPEKIIVGGPKAAEITIYCSQDQLIAGMLVSPPRGAESSDISREQIQEALKAARITQGIREEILNTFLSPDHQQTFRANGTPECWLIAMGQAAQQGEDGWLEPLVEDVSDRRPVIHEEDDRVDFLDHGEFPHVEPNTPLARRHPPTEGHNGFTVTGKTLKGRDGKEINFRLSDNSVHVSFEDENLLLSSIAGLPVLHEHGAKVDQVLKVAEVGLQSGHIDFDGSVQIKGNVNAGMHVKATGDIKIGGLVEKASIEAGGNIEIGGGVIGHKSNSPENRWGEQSEPSKEDAILKAKNNIKARFIQEAWVECGGTIIVEKQVMHSHLYAESTVQLTGQGKIVGGFTRANAKIDTDTAGVPANIPTHLEVGMCDALKAELTELNQQRHKLTEQMEQLKDVVEKLKRSRKPIPDEKKRQILKAKQTLTTQAEALNEEHDRVEMSMAQQQIARIQVRKVCHPGTNLIIAGKSYSPRNELGKVTFFLRDGDIRMR